MKKTLILSVAIAIASGTITSCKKGDNDPFLSLKSRKGRLSGDWSVSNFSTTTKHTNNSGVTTTTDSEFDGTTLTKTVSYSDNTPSSTSTYTFSDYSYTFNKDNTYKMTEAYTYTESDTTTVFGGESITTTVHTVTIESDGNWSFIGKQKGDFKNKERFSTQETNYSFKDVQNTTTVTTVSGNTSTSTNQVTITQTTTDDVPSMGNINIMDELKSKEIIIKSENNQTNQTTNGSNLNQSSDSYTGTYTFTAK